MDVVVYIALGVNVLAILVAVPLAVNETVKIVRAASGIKKDMKKLEAYKKKQLEKKEPLTEGEINRIKKIVERNMKIKRKLLVNLDPKKKAELQSLHKKFESSFTKVRDSVRMSQKSMGKIFSKKSFKKSKKKKKNLPKSPNEEGEGGSDVEIEETKEEEEEEEVEAEEKGEREEEEEEEEGEDEKYSNSFKKNLFVREKKKKKTKKKGNFFRNLFGISSSKESKFEEMIEEKEKEKL